MINWLLVGSETARALIILAIGALLFRKFVAPGINEAVLDVQEAVKKITTVASLAGIKSQEFKDAKGLEKVVAADLINQKLPELEALKLILSPDAWEKVEDTIEDNPEAILQLYQRYGHLIGGLERQEKPKLDF